MLSQDEIIAVVSSVTVFIVASIVFTIVGFLCGYCRCQAKRKCYAETARSSEEMYNNTSYYDDIIVLKQRDEQELELKENVAYAG